MEDKKSISPALVAAAIVLLLAFIGFIAFRSFGGGGSEASASAPGGEQAKTVAPQVQKYDDGTVVPYNAAPSGAIPGNPASVTR